MMKTGVAVIDVVTVRSDDSGRIAMRAGAEEMSALAHVEGIDARNESKAQRKRNAARVLCSRE
jgi:hypothetical protein